MTQFRLDLHTHSMSSPEGSLRDEDYKRLINDPEEPYVLAVADHNRIDNAIRLHELLGDRIIVAEEVSSTDGHVVGVFLKRKISKGKSLSQTADDIHTQGGLVYIPHPNEKRRHGVNLQTLLDNINDVDIIEVHNPRSFSRRSGQLALAVAKEHGIVMASSSDAHARSGLGSAYSLVSGEPTRANVTKLLKEADLVRGKIGLLGMAAPFINRVKGRLQIK